MSEPSNNNNNSNESSSITKSLRLSINYKYFNSHPVRAIKQLIGQNATLISYKQNSIVKWDGNVIVDIVYKSIPIDQFSIYYVPIKDIKHLIPNSEKYVVVVNGCNVKLNNPKVNQFHDYLPIRIKKTIINDTDKYENYYTETTDGNMELKTDSHELTNYFGTTVSNPMNSLITPLNILTNSSNLSINQSEEDKEHEKEINDNYGFNVVIPPSLYPSDFKPKDMYSLDDTIKYYRQIAQTIPALSIIQDIKQVDKLPTSQTMSTTGYLIDVDLLPSNGINGIVLIQPKRICELILYYPTNNYMISSEEIKSIKDFVKMDRINYNNFMFVKV